MNGCVLLCIAMYGYVGLCMVVYGYVGLCRAMYGCVFLCMAMQGYVCLCRAMYGYVGLCMKSPFNLIVIFFIFLRMMTYLSTDKNHLLQTGGFELISDPVFVAPWL